MRWRHFPLRLRFSRDSPPPHPLISLPLRENAKEENCLDLINKSWQRGNCGGCLLLFISVPSLNRDFLPSPSLTTLLFKFFLNVGHSVRIFSMIYSRRTSLSHPVSSSPPFFLPTDFFPLSFIWNSQDRWKIYFSFFSFFNGMFR